MYVMFSLSCEGSRYGTYSRLLSLLSEDQVTKRGKTATGKQRYRCHNPDCPHQSFLLNPAYKGRLPEIKQQAIEMSLNASGVRDTARVLQISTRTVLNELKQKGSAIIGAVGCWRMSLVDAKMRSFWS